VPPRHDYAAPDCAQISYQAEERGKQRGEGEGGERKILSPGNRWGFPLASKVAAPEGERGRGRGEGGEHERAQTSVASRAVFPRINFSPYKVPAERCFIYRAGGNIPIFFAAARRAISFEARRQRATPG